LSAENEDLKHSLLSVPSTPTTPSRPKKDVVLNINLAFTRKDLRDKAIAQIRKLYESLDNATANPIQRGTLADYSLAKVVRDKIEEYRDIYEENAKLVENEVKRLEKITYDTSRSDATRKTAAHNLQIYNGVLENAHMILDEFGPIILDESFEGRDISF